MPILSYGQKDSVNKLCFTPEEMSFWYKQNRKVKSLQRDTSSYLQDIKDYKRIIKVKDSIKVANSVQIESLTKIKNDCREQNKILSDNNDKLEKKKKIWVRVALAELAYSIITTGIIILIGYLVL